MGLSYKALDCVPLDTLLSEDILKDLLIFISCNFMHINKKLKSLNSLISLIWKSNALNTPVEFLFEKIYIVTIM